MKTRLTLAKAYLLGAAFVLSMATLHYALGW